MTDGHVATAKARYAYMRRAVKTDPIGYCDFQ